MWRCAALAGLARQHGPLAQLAEQRTFNPRVAGSIPAGPTLSSGYVSRTVTVAPGLPTLSTLYFWQGLRVQPLPVPSEDEAGDEWDGDDEGDEHVPSSTREQQS
jgi:hypothetical protein